MTITNKTAVILNGSPRKHGNTAVVTQWFVDALEQNHYAIKKYDLYNLKFQGCAHCNVCKKDSSKPNCVLNDDFVPILEQLFAAEKIIIISPVYCWSVSGCMSAALDRFYALFKDNLSLIANKKIIGAFTAGGDHFQGLELCVAMLKHLCDFGNAKYIGILAAANCSDPKELNGRKALQQEVLQLLQN